MIIAAILVLILLTLLFGAAAVRGTISTGCGLILLSVPLALLLGALSRVTADQWAWTAGGIAVIASLVWGGKYFLQSDERLRTRNLDNFKRAQARRLKRIDAEKAEQSEQLRKRQRLAEEEAKHADELGVRAMSLMSVFYELHEVTSDVDKETAFELSRFNRIEELESLVRQICEANGIALRFDDGKYVRGRPDR